MTIRFQKLAQWVAASALASALCLPLGCGASGSSAPGADPPTDPSATADGAPPPGPDGGTPGNDAAPPTFDDGKATRLACTSTLGKTLTQVRGRLDGQLVAIVGANERRCLADSQHLHLQVLMNGAVYDIAVNLDGLEGETDAKLPGAPFAEGWHPMTLDYVKDLGLHSTALTVTSPDVIRQQVTTALANANHISVFGEGYQGLDGVHLIHRSRGQDGALVINPLAPKAHVIAFRFATDTF